MNCLDTDLLIAILRGKKEAAPIADTLDEQSTQATTSVNAFEIFFGAYHSERKNDNLREAQKLLERLEVMSLDTKGAKRAGEIMSQLSSKGEPIDFRDALIAGIALENDLTVLTRNQTHFDRMKGLKTQKW